MKLSYQNTGINVAVGIEGKKEEIRQQYNSFFNHGAIDRTADLHWLGPTFAFVWSDDKRLEKYFKNSSYHKVLNEFEGEQDKTSGPIISRKIKTMAKERFQELLNNREVIVRYKKSGDFYTEGKVGAEDLSDSDS